MKMIKKFIIIQSKYNYKIIQINIYKNKKNQYKKKIKINNKQHLIFFCQVKTNKVKMTKIMKIKITLTIKIIKIHLNNVNHWKNQCSSSLMMKNM